MSRPIRSVVLALTAAALPAAATARTAPATSPAAETQAIDLAKALIALRTVRGEGNRTGDALRLVKQTLAGAGWQDGDVEIVPVDDTAYLIATWRGSDAKLKPLVISGHMDVVEARASDWERDPFVPVVENGYLYGRGATDMKFDAAVATTALVELRRAGYRPKRTIVLQFSGDEETTMKTSRLIAERLKHSEYVINIDGGGGTLAEATNQPAYWSWQGGEKTYVDYALTVTNPGGHSSAPRPDNAIAQLATALARIGSYRFPPEQNALTKAYFEAAAKFEGDPALAAAMRAFAANPNDMAAVEVLRASPTYIGKIGTTCVPTMVSGGHAENALPQSARANVNCRIFPGHSRDEIRAALEKVAGVPEVKITDATGGDSIESAASPMRPDVMAAIGKAINRAWPGVPVVPTQSAGATDSMWFRALGVPSYGASPTFSKDSDDYSHGLNERVQVKNTGPGITYYLSLFTDLSK